VLDEYGELASRGISHYLAGVEFPELAGLLADYPSRGGRSLRASLCIASARAFGAGPGEAIQSAIALELMHNAFLVHDDIEDESEERRGRPALHVLHGVPIALNAGDGLAVMSLEPLIHNRLILGPHLAFRVFAEAQRMACEAIEGQTLELKWRDENEVELSADDYLRMVLKKTCWYTTIYPCRVGALIGSRDGLELDVFVRFGFFLGAAFQIQDDLLNLTGDHRRYGKELGGDIREGKRTLMLIHLLGAVADDTRRRLERVLAAPRAERTDEQVRWIFGLMEENGSVNYARETANALAGAAAFEFDQAFSRAPASRDRDFIEALPYWMLERA
jgi:geranylgeranyl diphosphate synthase, type II